MTVAFPHSAEVLQDRFGPAMYSRSYATQSGAAFWLMRASQGKQLAVLTYAENPVLDILTGTTESFDDILVLKRCPTTHSNARALREALLWLRPTLLNLSTSAGFGDRLGLATPGHVDALQAAQRPSGRTIAPIFAQQSIREMMRTSRTPDDVMTEATWGAFQAGWQGPVGADADHL